jgi:hypothetical protein
MRGRKASLAFATVATALVGTAAFDGVSARRGWDKSADDLKQVLRVPQPSQTQPGTTSRRPNMRMVPSMGGRGMGGGRVNGGMGRR